MDEAIWTQVERYYDSLLLPADQALEAAQRRSEEAGLPAIAITPAMGKFLQMLARMQGARRILEIGTLGGYSTIWLARALPTEGHLITLELDDTCVRVAAENLRGAGVADRVDIRRGPALASLAQLRAEGAEPFDFIFLDADKESYTAYFPVCRKLARPGTVIVADNVVRQGEIADPEALSPNTQGVRKFNDLVAAEPGVSATVLQTVGSKDYDGFMLIRVEG